MADKFEDLRTYTTVVSCGGVNAAAAEMGIAKSAVSRRVSDLENRLGISLIERTTRRFELTAVGREYFQRARDLLDALERLDADPAGRSSHEEISISARHDILAHLVAPAIATFRARHVDVTLRLLREGPADLSLSAGVVSDGAIRLGSFEHILCASPGYIAEREEVSSASDLGAHTSIQIDGDTGPGWGAGGGPRRRPRDVVQAPDADVAFALAVSGAGVAQLPDFVAKTAVRDGRLTVILAGQEPPPSDLIARFAADASASVKALADYLGSAFAQRI